MIVFTEIQADIAIKRSIPQIYVKQGDTNSRGIRLCLSENGTAWSIPEGVSPVIRYRRIPDGTGGIYDTLEDGTSACTVSDNVINIILAPQMLALSGDVLMDVALVKDDALLATYNIPIFVEFSPQEGAAIEAEGYFNLAKVTAAYESLATAIDEANKEISENAAAALKEVADAKSAAVSAVPDVVNAWLDEHPEATTSVQDGAISPKKTSFIHYDEYQEADTVLPNFTNQIPVSTDDSGNVLGIVSNAYLSSSSGGTSTMADYETTGYIPLSGSGDVLRLEGMVFSSTDGYCRLAFYQADKTFIGTVTGSAILVDSAFTDLYTLDGSGYYTYIDLTAKENHFEVNKGTPVGYLRICAQAIDSASILTVNEQISYTTIPGELVQTNLVLDESITVPQAEENKTAVEELDQRVETLEAAEVPDYVRQEAQRLAEVVRSHQNENTFTFLAMSDFHQTAEVSQISAGNRHAGQAAALLRQMVHMDFAAALGDYTWGSSTTTIEEGISEIQQVNEWIAEGFRGIPNFRTIGNHDILTLSWAQNGDYLTNSELWPLVGAYNADAVLPHSDRSRTMCYRDFSNYKLRVIMLNTTDEKGQTVTDTNNAYMHVHAAQAQWLADALDLSDKSDAAEWGIVLLSHFPLDWGRNMELVPMLQSLIEGTSGSLTRDSQTVTWNFSGENRAHFIAQFHGHVHGFRVDNIHSGTETTIDLKRIAIPNACFRRNNEYGQNDAADSNSIEFGEETTYDKAEGICEDTAFCVVTVDTAKRIIYADHYGAGYDRVISY